MVERIIRPITSDGKITVPKELREKYKLKDYVEFAETPQGLIIKAHQRIIMELTKEDITQIKKLIKELKEGNEIYRKTIIEAEKEIAVLEKIIA